MCAWPHDTLTAQGRGEGQLAEKADEHLDIVMDSSGLTIFGEGEWKVRSHGKSKRRTWRKLHIGVDPHSGEIQAAALTTNNVSDSQMVTSLLAQIEQPIKRFAGDGSYDKRNVYDSLNKYAPDAVILILRRKNARIWQHGNTKSEWLNWDENLRAIRKSGRKALKQDSSYHILSLAETTMFPLKLSLATDCLLVFAGDASHTSPDLLCCT